MFRCVIISYNGASGIATIRDMYRQFSVIYDESAIIIQGKDF